MPVGSVISAGSMPIFSSKHSSGSAEPVTIAIFGRSPSLLVLGQAMSCRRRAASTRSPARSAMITWRRHLPSWMTSGMLVPTGTLVSVKLPLESVVVMTTGSPETLPLQRSQVTPSVNGAGVVLGT